MKTRITLVAGCIAFAISTRVVAEFVPPEWTITGDPSNGGMISIEPNAMTITSAKEPHWGPSVWTATWTVPTSGPISFYWEVLDNVFAGNLCNFYASGAGTLVDWTTPAGEVHGCTVVLQEGQEFHFSVSSTGSLWGYMTVGIWGFPTVPSPGAAALLCAAALIGRRRR